MSNGRFIVSECKNSAQKLVEDLPKPDFVEFENGTIADMKNHLLWIKTEVPNQKKNFNDAERFAKSYSIEKQSNW